MSSHSRTLGVFAVIAAVMLSMTAAQAQYYSGASQPAPLYPYAAQQDRLYRVQQVPNTYAIQRPPNTRAYPYVRSHSAYNPASEQSALRFDRRHKPADRALIAELRKRASVKRTVINTTKIVRDPPVVVETERVIDDPPRLVERRHVVEDEPVHSRRKKANFAEPKLARRDDNKKRVIQADAEVTILGPDRMSIRLFRKGQGPKANVPPE